MTWVDTWIPASAGMTEYGAAECCRESEGVPRSHFPYPPRLGVGGLKAGMNVVLDEAEEVTYGGGFRFALSALHLPRV